MKKSVEHRLEEIFLIALILLNVLEFTGFLSADFSITKKIISWLCMGYLFYRVSLTKVFFGTKNRVIDATIIITFFMFLFKNLFFSVVLMNERSSLDFFVGFYDFLYANGAILDKTLFILGGILILAHALYLVFNLHVKKPSLMNVIHEGGIPKTIGKKIERFFIIFAVLVGFFIIVFNLVMEWLTLAIDASILVFTLVFYLVTIFTRHYKKLDAEHFIFKVGSSAEKFYANFINLFHTKRIVMGISGMLVLHLLTDIGNFIVPFVFGNMESLYYSSLGYDIGHLSLIDLIASDWSKVIGLSKITIIATYLLNIAAILFFLFAPAYIWYKMYKKKGFRVNRLSLAIIAAAIVCFILCPVFETSSLNEEISKDCSPYCTGEEDKSSANIIGVNIQTKSALDDPLVKQPFSCLLSLLAGIIIYMTSHSHKIKEKMIMIFIAIIDSFVALYIFSFVSKIIAYYVGSKGAIFSILSQGGYFIAFYLFLFFLITILFYIMGFIVFVKETIKEFRYIK